MEFLGNDNPLIRNNKLTFRNLNRLFYFISTSPPPSAPQNTHQLFTNIQISLSTFIIGLFLYRIEAGKLTYKENMKIHDDTRINDYIHNMYRKPLTLKNKYNTTLSLVYSNGDAILTPIQYNVVISERVYFVLLMLNRIENNPLLYFINNSDATEDILNYILAEIDITKTSENKE